MHGARRPVFDGFGLAGTTTVMEAVCGAAPGGSVGHGPESIDALARLFADSHSMPIAMSDERSNHVVLTAPTCRIRHDGLVSYALYRE